MNVSTEAMMGRLMLRMAQIEGHVKAPEMKPAAPSLKDEIAHVRRGRILDYLRKNGPLTMHQMRACLAIPKFHLQRDLTFLRRLGVIERDNHNWSVKPTFITRRTTRRAEA